MKSTLHHASTPASLPSVWADVALNLAGQTLTGFNPGQTVKLSVRAGNTAGNTDGPEVTVTTTA